MAASTTLNAEQRIERARKAHLASSVNAVEKRADELTPDEKRRILNAVAAEAIVADWPEFSPELTSKLCRIFARSI